MKGLLGLQKHVKWILYDLLKWRTGLKCRTDLPSNDRLARYLINAAKQYERRSLVPRFWLSLVLPGPTEVKTTLAHLFANTEKWRY